MMNRHVVRGTLGGLALAVTLGLPGCGSNNDAGEMGGMAHSVSPMPTASSSDASAGSSTAAQFNAADVMFVQGMLPHHKQAVVMSDSLLKKSRVSPTTTALAKQIKAAQQPEITTMEGWLKTWGKDTGGMAGMDHGGMADDGMATDAELKKLDQADGASAEKAYLEMMTTHHGGAIKMAQAEVKNGKSADAVQLAKDIATSQAAEITTMEKLLANL